MASIGFGGLLLALLLVQAHAVKFSPYSQQFPPTQATLSTDFCTTFGQNALLFPSNMLCLGAGLTSQGVSGSSCQLLAIAQQTVLSLASPVSTCPAMMQKPVAKTSLDGKHLLSQAFVMSGCLPAVP
jgi:hypothetical protein